MHNEFIPAVFLFKMLLSLINGRTIFIHFSGEFSFPVLRQAAVPFSGQILTDICIMGKYRNIVWKISARPGHGR
ncbi:hypothetical protein SK237_15750 [Novacetimonas hansenii]|uniref:hypothetical protein n=1 Tax=Novacetimonas hansenii TaxID=436 RepID=UPI00131EF59C|nr:hypothetical protein [Novacetimonas hansenii]